MNIKSRIILAGTLLFSSPVVADSGAVPDICKTTINYTVQALLLGFSDGSYAVRNDPDSVTLHKNFKDYPITTVKSFDCDSDEWPKSWPQSWCRVAGGEPGVYEVNVSMPDGSGGYFPFVTVTITYNRGLCGVDKIDIVPSE